MDGKIVGDAFVGRSQGQAVEHRAVVGVGLNSERGKGIGYRMMKTLERLAIENFNAKMLYLEVFEHNKVARNLYKKCGFRETGRIPKGFIHYGKYMDDILMVKEL
jgi:RimJ/RimL family protein N-acetyltransferase